MASNQEQRGFQLFSRLPVELQLQVIDSAIDPENTIFGRGWERLDSLALVSHQWNHEVDKALLTYSHEWTAGDFPFLERAAFGSRFQKIKEFRFSIELEGLYQASRPLDSDYLEVHEDDEARMSRTLDGVFARMFNVLARRNPGGDPTCELSRPMEITYGMDIGCDLVPESMSRVREVDFNSLPELHNVKSWSYTATPFVDKYLFNLSSVAQASLVSRLPALESYEWLVEQSLEDADVSSEEDSPEAWAKSLCTAGKSITDLQIRRLHFDVTGIHPPPLGTVNMWDDLAPYALQTAQSLFKGLATSWNLQLTSLDLKSVINPADFLRWTADGARPCTWPQLKTLKINGSQLEDADFWHALRDTLRSFIAAFSRFPVLDYAELQYGVWGNLSLHFLDARTVSADKLKTSRLFSNIRNKMPLYVDIFGELEDGVTVTSIAPDLQEAVEASRGFRPTISCREMTGRMKVVMPGDEDRSFVFGDFTEAPSQEDPSEEPNIEDMIDWEDDSDDTITWEDDSEDAISWSFISWDTALGETTRPGTI